MSDLLNKASLVMIPSGYKEDVVYSQIPTDGSGDLSFTRASNGTRINSAGLVEVCPWNLAQYSEDFSNAYWTKNRSSITANSTTAPNGTTTADSLIEDTANGTHEFITVLAVDLQTYSFSIYAKANTRSKIQLVLAGTPWATGGNGEVSFDLSTGAVISAVNGASGVIESVGNSWYRCTITKITSVADPSGVLAIRLLDASGNSSYTGNGTSSAYIWGAQLNIGATAKPYFPTTDRLNVPRLTYQNGGGGCPSLLLEKQSTNFLKYSEQFDDAIWTKTNGNGGSAPIITANHGVSPDGTQNADRIQLERTTQTNSFSYVYQTYSGTIGSAYTWSVWLKSLSGTPIVALSFNGTIYTNNVTLTSEWQRYTFTTNATGTDLQATFLLFEPNGTSLTADFLAWGWQLEQSSYATSYIGPTTLSSATRVADACFKTGISSLIGQTEGVMFVDVDLTHSNSGSNEYLGQIRQDSGNRILLYRSSSTFGIGVVVLRSGGTIFSSVSSVSSNSRHKIAIAYKSGDLAFYIDGNQIATNTTTFSAYSSLSEFDLGNNNTSGTPVEFGDYEYKEALLFPTRLTNAELASLTTI